MRLIALNRFYWPDHSASAQMLTDLAQHMARHGHEVTIITSRLCYEGGARLPARETNEGVAIRRVATTAFGRAGLVGRIIDYLSFYLAASWELVFTARRGDVVLVKTDPPLLSVPIAILGLFKPIKLVNWCQDLFPETAVALGIKWAGGGSGNVLRKIRNWSLNRAILNAALNTRMAGVLRRQNVAARRIQVLENWADADIRPVPHHRNPLRHDWELGARFVIAYSGNLGRAHIPDAVVDLVERTKAIEGLAWLFIGGGAGLDAVRDAANGAPNVYFRPYQPRDRLSYSLSAADAHLISLAPSCEGYIAPSKLYGALAAGRPILFLGHREGAIARRIAAEGFGALLDVEAPETWVQTITTFRSRYSLLSSDTAAGFTANALESWRSALEAAADGGSRSRDMHNARAQGQKQDAKCDLQRRAGAKAAQ
ncbi:MAG: glycosyltransferase family 4 protein [Hyphomonadaceae bacterium]|nr:glycosyltransferase family 4 protein [Hyphomonadaceae bacterium]MBY0565119.1 glycosyltransferase family 4 protein [Hyphomonadaceae bacterium]